MTTWKALGLTALLLAFFLFYVPGPDRPAATEASVGWWTRSPDEKRIDPEAAMKKALDGAETASVRREPAPAESTPPPPEPSRTTEPGDPLSDLEDLLAEVRNHPLQSTLEAVRNELGPGTCDRIIERLTLLEREDRIDLVSWLRFESDPNAAALMLHALARIRKLPPLTGFLEELALEGRTDGHRCHAIRLLARTRDRARIRRVATSLLSWRVDGPVLETLLETLNTGEAWDPEIRPLVTELAHHPDEAIRTLAGKLSQPQIQTGVITHLEPIQVETSVEPFSVMGHHTNVGDVNSADIQVLLKDAEELLKQYEKSKNPVSETPVVHLSDGSRNPARFSISSNLNVIVE